MGALRLWEQALGTAPTREQRLAALYNAACVHASFGDLELAQIPLKDGGRGRLLAAGSAARAAAAGRVEWAPALLQCPPLVESASTASALRVPWLCRAAIYGGLDFAAALAGEDPRYVKMKASAQVGGRAWWGAWHEGCGTAGLPVVRHAGHLQRLERQRWTVCPPHPHHLPAGAHTAAQVQRAHRGREGAGGQQPRRPPAVCEQRQRQRRRQPGQRQGPAGPGHVGGAEHRWAG